MAGETYPTIIFDSGATHTMINSPELFIGPLAPRSATALTASGEPLAAIGDGDAGILGHGILVPGLDYSLLSTRQDDQLGLWSIFGGGAVNVYDEPPVPAGNIVRNGFLRDMHYVYDKGPDSAAPARRPSCAFSTPTALAASIGPATQRFYHRIIGPHACLSRMNATLGIANGLVVGPFRDLDWNCSSCLTAKITRMAVPASAPNRPAAVPYPRRIRSEHVHLCFDTFEGSRTAESWQGSRYVTLFKDRESEMEFSFFHKKKEGFTPHALRPMLQTLVTAGKTLGSFRSDGEPLYWTQSNVAIVRKIFPQVQFETSPANCPEFNGFVERAIGWLSADTRALLADAPYLGIRAWQSAMTYAVEAHNKSATTGAALTPYERWHGTRPSFAKTLPFGIPAFIYLAESERTGPSTRFQMRGREVILLRESPDGRPGYEVYDATEKEIGKVGRGIQRIKVRYDVHVDPIYRRSQPALNRHLLAPLLTHMQGQPPQDNDIEDPIDLIRREQPARGPLLLSDIGTDDPSSATNPPPAPPPPIPSTASAVGGDRPAQGPALPAAVEDGRPGQDHSAAWDRSSHVSIRETDPRREVFDLADDDISLREELDACYVSFPYLEPAAAALETTRNDHRTIAAVTKLGSISNGKRRGPGGRRIPSPLASLARGRSPILQRREPAIPLPPPGPAGPAPIPDWRGIDLDDHHRELRRLLGRSFATAATVTSTDPAAFLEPMPPTPTSEKEALEGPWREQWLEAMAVERRGIEAQKTWVLAPELDRAAVKSRWAWRISREANGKLKFRARIVAKGYTERYGVDYLETFAPTASTKSLMMVLHIAASEDWEIRTMDVSNAYLEAPAPNDHLYMELPTSEVGPSGGKVVVRLLKTLYGLKEAGFEWNRRVDGILRGGGWNRCFADPCVYWKDSPGGIILAVIYVDDVIYMGKDISAILGLESLIERNVRQVKLQGEAKKFLGLEITRDRAARTLTVTQASYIKDMAGDEGLLETSSKDTPAAVSPDLLLEPKGSEPNLRSIVGKLRYPADRAHPGTLYGMSMLAAVQAEPSPVHWKAAQRMLKYLNGARDKGVTLGGADPISLECWVDASHREEGEARSQLGVTMRLGPNTGCFFSRSIRDPHVSYSSAEAELRGFALGTFEVLWARGLLEEIGYGSRAATPIYEDNQAVTDLLSSLAKPSGGMKHANKLRRTIQQYMDSHDITCVKTPGEFNLADLFTKALDVGRYRMLNAMVTGPVSHGG